MKTNTVKHVVKGWDKENLIVALKCEERDLKALKEELDGVSEYDYEYLEDETMVIEEVFNRRSDLEEEIAICEDNLKLIQGRLQEFELG